MTSSWGQVSAPRSPEKFSQMDDHPSQVVDNKQVKAVAEKVP